jgi:hypothetical protein
MIRAGLFVLLLGTAATVAAPGAWARSNSTMSGGQSMGNAHIVARPVFSHRHHRIDARLHHRFAHIDGRRVLPGFAGAGGDYDGYDATNLGAGSPPEAVEAGDPMPARAAIVVREPRATVETTADGVSVVRGPGSHHLD